VCLHGQLRQRSLRLLSKICGTQKITLIHYSEGVFARLAGSLQRWVRRRERRGVLEVPRGYKAFRGERAGLGRDSRGVSSGSTSRISLPGISVSTDPHYFRILTEWMPNPDLMQCGSSNPEANRPRFVSPLAVSPSPLSCSSRAFSHALLGHVWCGYLRDLKIVHGDLKGA